MAEDDGDGPSESDLWGMLEDADGAERAVIMHELGARLFARGEFEQSVVLAESAADQARKMGDDVLTARSLYGQAAGLRRLGRLEDTVTIAMKAADILRSSADQSDIAECHAIAGFALVDMGQDTSSLEQWESAARLYLSEEEFADAGRMLMHRGESLSRLGRSEEALEEFDRARDLFRSARQAAAVPWADDRAATALADLGRVDEALDRLEAALHVREAQQELQLTGYAFFRMGWGMRLALRFDDALTNLEVAAGIFDDLGDIDGRARCDLEAANTLAMVGDFEEADNIYRRTRAVFDAEGFDDQVILVDANRAVLLSHQGRAAEAEAINSRLLPRALATGHHSLAAEVRSRLARNLLDLGRPMEALDLLAETTDDETAALGDRADSLELTALRASILLEIDPEQALEVADAALAQWGSQDRWADVASLYEVRGRARMNGRRTRTAERDLAHAVALYLAAGMTERATEVSAQLMPSKSAARNRLADLGKSLRGRPPHVPLPTEP